ncbi:MULTISPECIES: class I SAM-dependent methyltransferase [unclassified Pseudodesulfovibrio]|uniref:class I SAM-dependent methyltransferase n=1 Tax=unclassified Pseudodesulfovibrio TaxID=2661612 RepID=UPI000FEB6EF7|nr:MULTISPECIES: class I SAM-dependent methyltransferase [unclassified Pseudodesulfovibrio]MCJ2165942.1 class I SAM-dependent methyltransferase [Pseudodesulfovibrio sp. S3-i]RWU02618.1 class I SAM-dependent methyltransferase [Pseudodesulfovibrio sp. S3]
MGLSFPAVQAIVGLWKDKHFEGKKKVLEIGSQELHLTFDDFKNLMESYGVDGFQEKNFEEWGWEDRGKCYFAERLYSLLGFEDYACFDMNGDNKAIAHDLNFPFMDDSHWGQYDLVTDFGCAEHIFNVSEVYRTMHQVCRPGGIFIHCQQMFNTNGYYLFEPSFYEDIAAANGYEILFSSFIVTAHSSIKESGKYSWLLPMSSELIEIMDWTKISSIGLLYAMKKTKDADFQLPYQGSYMSTMYGNLGYDIASLSTYRRPTRTYVPVFERKDDISSREFKRVCRSYFKKKLGLR